MKFFFHSTYLAESSESYHYCEDQLFTQKNILDSKGKYRHNKTTPCPKLQPLWKGTSLNLNEGGSSHHWSNLTIAKHELRGLGVGIPLDTNIWGDLGWGRYIICADWFSSQVPRKEKPFPSGTHTDLCRRKYYESVYPWARTARKFKSRPSVQ